jgi:hypothetical protein
VSQIGPPRDGSLISPAINQPVSGARARERPSGGDADKSSIPEDKLWVAGDLALAVAELAVPAVTPTKGQAVN